MSNNTFVILDASEVVEIDFSEVIEDSAETLRYSLDGAKTFVKFSGNPPEFLEGKDTLTHSEMREELEGADWTPEVDAPTE